RHGLLHGHAAAERHLQVTEIYGSETWGVEQRVEQRIDAGEEYERLPAHFLHQCREVARIDDENVLPAEVHEEEAVRGEREYVIERDGGDQHAGVVREAAGEPRLRLQDVGAD